MEHRGNLNRQYNVQDTGSRDHDNEIDDTGRRHHGIPTTSAHLSLEVDGGI